MIMEVLHPAEPVVQQVTQRTDVPKELVDAGLTMKNVEILNHLGLQHQMFNPNVMEKVQFIADKVEDILMLQDIDMRLGDDGSMPRIDKLYSYLKLKDQAERIKEEERIVSERINSYERR